MTDFTLRPLESADSDDVAAFIAARWVASIVVVHDTLYTPAALPGFLACRGDEWLGLVTYHLAGEGCEIVTLDSLHPGLGIGTALVEAVRQAADEARCRRLWVITTNDNLNALRFYQKRGFVLVAVHRDAVTRARLIKPEIPLLGLDGIPIRDEIELEMLLPMPDQASSRQAR
jgi:DNA-3-methyladenine glycosylase I